MAEINSLDSSIYRSIPSDALVIIFALSSPFHSRLLQYFQGVSSGLCPVFHRISSFAAPRKDHAA
jgi:hypothetical protein